jgi:hypothetical protein
VGRDKTGPMGFRWVLISSVLESGDWGDEHKSGILA